MDSAGRKPLAAIAPRRLETVDPPRLAVTDEEPFRFARRYGWRELGWFLVVAVVAGIGIGVIVNWQEIVTAVQDALARLLIWYCVGVVIYVWLFAR